MRNVIVVLIILPILLGGIVFLQIFLSRRDSRWPGLVLPGISFLFSLLAILGIALSYRVGTVTQFGENGTVIEQYVQPMTSGDWVSLAVGGLMTFLLTNIPTAVLLAIYAACREKIRKNRAMEKMRAQDLE